MKFYNREKELLSISNILSRSGADLVYIYGRRRIGKTSLILKAIEKEKFLYFFVGDKTGKELLNDFSSTLQYILKMNYLNFSNFRDLFSFIFDYSKQNKLVLVFDEFQNFFNINPSVFSDLQYFWDINKDLSKIKLFCLGSHFTLMKEIFENNKTPLFGRKTASFYLKSFDVNTQIKILSDYNLAYPQNLLYFYSIFYGIPKYIEIFLRELDLYQEKDFLEKLLDIFIKENSFFLFEGKELFALEFSKSYDIYFSILTAIASSKTKKNEIADFTGISYDSLGIYLKKLEDYFELIDRQLPITEKKSSKNSRYKIKDLFLKFWFRYIFKYSYLLEIKDFEGLRDFIKKDILVFLGITFEDLAREIIIEENLKNKLPFRIEKIGTYFDKNGQNEIDLVCINSKEKKVLFIECKINSKNINLAELDKLKKKTKDTGIYQNYKKYFGFASLEESSVETDYFLCVSSYMK